MTLIERRVPFNVLAPAVEAMRAELDAALKRVLDRGWFVMGPELEDFERQFGAYHGADVRAIGVGSGTDALTIGLRALGIQQGHEVLVTANAGVPPVAAIVAAGGTPAYCDVDPATHNLDPEEIDRRATGRTRAVLVVHLYGQPAPMDQIVERARKRGLKVLEDCAQAHGARYAGRLVGTFGDAAAFSFYPTKNLGALGDAGALLTADPEVAERATLLRMYGWRTRYVSEVHSTVSRMDELQAAVLSARLAHLDDWNAARRRLAERYRAQLPDTVELPPADGVFHLFVVKSRQRDALKSHLSAHGVGSDIHYPAPVHRQAPYSDPRISLPVTERLAGEVLSLPMYPHLPEADVDYVAQVVRAHGA